jgi:transposase
MSAVYVGMDVHSKWSSFVIERADASIVARGQVPTSPEGYAALKAQYGVPSGTRVGLETGVMAFYAARTLQNLDLHPVVIDAHEVRLKAHRPRQKSDRRDALEICEGLRRDIYRAIIHVPPDRIVQLRQTLALRRHFVRVQSAEVNAAKHILHSAGVGKLCRPMQQEASWQRVLEQLAAPLRARVELHHQVWRVAGDQVLALDSSLVEQSALFADDFRRLQTVPGVGPIVALTAIAAFSDVRRFPSAKHAASYAGLVPSTNQSGARDWHGHITRRGSTELRAMLVEAAHHTFRKSHPLNPYFRKLCAARGYKIAVVAIAHRLCRVLYAMLRDQVDFDLSKLAIEVGPFEEKVVRPYRLRRKPAA